MKTPTFWERIKDAFNHKPTKSEIDYSNMNLLLSQAQGWSNHNPELEDKVLETLIDYIVDVREGLKLTAKKDMPC